MNNRKIIGYNPQTGEPIYEEVQVQPKVVGYNPTTGEPIYESAQPAQPVQPAQPKVVGYNPNTGEPIYENVQPVQPKVVGYNPQTGEPIYDNPQGVMPGYNYAPKKSGSKTWLKVLLSILALAVIAGLAIGLFFTFRGNSSSSSGDEDSKPQKTVNDYDDDDNGNTGNNGNSGNTGNNDKKDYLELGGYKLEKYGNYEYALSDDELNVTTTHLYLDMVVTSRSYEYFTSQLSDLDDYFIEFFSDEGYKFYSAREKTYGSKEFISIEGYTKDYDKFMVLIVPIEKSNETLFVLYENMDGTYSYDYISEFYNVINSMKK